MAATVNQLLNQVLAFQYNPSLIQRAVLQTLTDVTNGTIEVVDPTNPFVFCLESSAVLTSAFLSKNETNTRRQYPYSAQTPEDLYVHMSDIDYLNRFAVPSSTRFSILLPEEEVLLKMVTDPSTGIRKLVIPRNAYFTVGDIDFSIQYPIEIRQLAHGGLQVVYDATISSPLQALVTNVIYSEIRQDASGVRWIYFEFDTQQFNILSQTGTLNAATDYSVNVVLSDQYYYTRVYVESVSKGWTEIKTTHTDQIYDPATPTAVLKVVNNQVTVSIPQLYTSTGLLNMSVRIDVYQTRGPLSLIMYSYPYSAFTATWRAIDIADQTVYTAPLKTFRTIIPYSDQVVSGGSNAVAFETLRLQVINNTLGTQSLPITNVQIASALAPLGYDVVKNIDSITNRVFLATKAMPIPINSKLITAAASSIETVSLTVTNAVLLTSIRDNGTSITITPDTLLTNTNGVVSLVPSAQVARLLSLDVTNRALVVTNGNYLYTPFHYVVDMASNELQVRPYYLDSPVIETKLFIAENDTTLLQVSTGSFSITRDATGYVLTIVTNSSAEYRSLPDNECFAQLAYVPAGEKDRAYLNGTQQGLSTTNERIYTFNLSTNFDVDANDNLQLQQFLLYTTEPRLTGANLLTDFDVLYSTSAALGSQHAVNTVDAYVGRFLLPVQIAGITHETLRVRFGYALTNLWARARSVVSSVPYKKWTVNVPRTYPTDVYLRDSNNSAITIDATGHPHSTLLHRAGDPVLDALGQPSYQYQIGDVMLDGSNMPIPTDVRSLLRQIDLMLIEGVYRFATDLAAVNYRETLTQTVVSQLMNDFTTINSDVLEQSRVYFYPKTTLGTFDVMVANGLIQSISAGQAFVVTLYVSALVYANIDLRLSLNKATTVVIAGQLTESVVSVDSISAALRTQYGLDVISVQISGLGGSLALPTFTILNDGHRCSIAKRLVALADQSLIVEEDITVNYVLHELVA